MMAKVSAEDVANEIGLAADELSKSCDNSIIPSLADYFSQWRVIFGSLLSEIDLGDVDRENTTEEEKRIAALRKWKARNGSEATYKILVDTLLNRGERSDAENICKILADHSMSNKHGQIPETTTTDCEAKESESDNVIRFECPCGECSLEIYLQKGCPKSCIPYLGMTTLSKEDQINLNFILKKDTKRIIKSFANLSNGTCKSLKLQGVTVDDLVRVAVNSDSSLHDQLIGSTSVDQVFTHLAPEMSFFNHDILEDIINELGDQNDKDRLANYSEEFKEFCKRKVFEVEPGHCPCGEYLKQRKPFAVVLPTGEKRLQNLGNAVSIKETLADVLGVPLATLHLHRIDRGSIILVFSVPCSIAEELFPLPKEKLALMRAKGMVLFVPQDSKSRMEMKPLACSADMHESSSKHTPTVPSGTPGELLISHSLPTSAQLSWTPVPEDDTIITGYTALCGSPEWLTVGCNDPTSVRLFWGSVPEDQRNEIIIGYSIRVEGPDTTSTPETGRYATSKEVSGLKPSTEYTFSVSAKTVAGSGLAISVSFITPQEALSNTIIGSLKTSQYHQTSVQISWAAIREDVVIGYTVQIEGPDSTREIPIRKNYNTSVRVYDLLPSTQYTFKVKALKVSGVTGELKVSHSLPTSAQLSWTPVPEHKRNDTVTGYIVRVEGPDSIQEIPVMDENATSYEVSDLRPYTTYTFSISTMMEAYVHAAPAISVSSTTPQGAPSGTPKWLTVGCSLPTSVQLSWGAVPKDQWNGKITDYSIQVEGPNTTRHIQIATDQGILRPRSTIEDTYTSKEVSDLKPSTEYSFSVSAVTVTGSGPTISVSFVTPQGALSNTVGRFKTSQYHPTSARISWKSVQKDDETVTGYTVRVEGPDSTREIPIPNKYSTSVGISDLLPLTQYTFKVITLGCGIPSELKVSHSLPTSVQLSWTPVPEDKQNDTITGYTVQVEGPDSTQEIPVMDGNATSYKVSDLRPYTTYTFSVSAMTEAGAGPPISIPSTTPQGAPSGTPKWLTVGCSHPTSVQLYWGAIPEDQRNGIITGYSIQVGGPDSTRSIRIAYDRIRIHRRHSLMKFEDSYTFEKVSNLRPSTEYTFSVSAKTVVGSGPAISVSFITPQKALSNTVGSLKTSQYQPMSAHIFWAAIRKNVVIGYTVQVEGPDSTQEIPVTNKHSTSVEISDLLPSTQYTFEVRAMKVSGAPGELKVSHSLPNSAQLSWTPVPKHKQNDTITGYTIQVEGPYSLEKTKHISVMNAAATSFEVSGLQPYTTYTFSISAVTKTGTGLAKSVSSTTPQGAPSGTPEWLTVGCSHPTSVRLYWMAVPRDQQNGIITGYSIRIEGPDSTRNIQTTTTVSGQVPPKRRSSSLKEDTYTSKKVSGLRPSTEYTFSVSAKTVAGSGPAISVSFVTPQKALSNTIGSFKTSQEDRYHPISAKIFWEAVEEESDVKTVTDYRVQVEGPDSTQVIPRNDKITSLEILYLRPSTQYIFKVSNVTVVAGIPAHYFHMSLKSDLLRESFGSDSYSWKSPFTAASGKNTAQYRMMLEYAPNLKDALADNMKVIWLAKELEKAGLITEDQRTSLETSSDADIRAAKLIGMVRTKVCYSSESFTAFLDVLIKDEATFEPILAKMKRRVPSGAPGELLVSHSLPTSAQLSWTPVPEDKQNDTITGYTIHVLVEKGSYIYDKRMIPVMDRNATSYEVSDLKPCTTYTFSVSTMTEAGAGPPIITTSTTPQGGFHSSWRVRRSLSPPDSLLELGSGSYFQEPIEHKARTGLFSDPLTLRRFRSSPDPSGPLKHDTSFQVNQMLIKQGAGQSKAGLLSDPQLRWRELLEPTSSYSQELVKLKVGKSRAGWRKDYPRLGLRSLPSSPGPSPKPGSYSQELIEHEAEQSTGRASLSTVYTKDELDEEEEPF